MNTILVIDDEENIRGFITAVLAGDGVELYTAGTGQEGLRLADEVAPDVVLLDVRLPDTDGMDLLRALKSRHPGIAIIIITGFGQIENAVEAIKGGATDFLEKPFPHPKKLRLAVDRALEEVRARREIQRLHALQQREHQPDQLIGESEVTRRLRDLIAQLARSEAQTILIQGESGTGKELVAKGLHYGSARRESPFLELNCAAITETLFESEIFGHERGAFTDAKAAKKGLFELADRGTLFLDEAGEMALGSQAKFLRCLQERVFRRVGGTRDIRSDVRVIAATNRPLEEAVRAGAFRADLFYRLNVIPVVIPPLRERREDVVPLARHFLVDANSRFHKSIKGFAPDTERALLAYTWPGNVRELKNLIERLVILGTDELIAPYHLPPPFTPVLALGGLSSATPARTLAAVEREHIVHVLESVGGNKSHAARVLGITRQTLKKKLQQFAADQFPPAGQPLTTDAPRRRPASAVTI